MISRIRKRPHQKAHHCSDHIKHRHLIHDDPSHHTKHGCIHHASPFSPHSSTQSPSNHTTSNHSFIIINHRHNSHRIPYINYLYCVHSLFLKRSPAEFRPESSVHPLVSSQSPSLQANPRPWRLLTRDAERSSQNNYVSPTT